MWCWWRVTRLAGVGLRALRQRLRPCPTRMALAHRRHSRRQSRRGSGLRKLRLRSLLLRLPLMPPIRKHRMRWRRPLWRLPLLTVRTRSLGLRLGRRGRAAGESMVSTPLWSPLTPISLTISRAMYGSSRTPLTSSLSCISGCSLTRFRVRTFLGGMLSSSRLR